ncbi:MAG: thermonuclease family protein [Dehalococcoidia bacterium]
MSRRAARDRRPRLVMLVALAMVALCGCEAAVEGQADGTPAMPAAAASRPAATATPAASATGISTIAPVTPGREAGTVTRVVDGDTIDVALEGGVARVRYIGIDTPETVDPRRPVQCFGVEASVENARLVEGRRVELERDVSETDPFDRLLRYVWVDGAMVNETLVRGGFAHALEYPPDVKHAELLRAAEREAREAGRGLWGACEADTPAPTSTPGARPQASDGVLGECAEGCAVAPPGCAIKGNINSEGERIYHEPGMEFYTRTVISPERDERWFCTPEEATANGWRRSMR